MRPGDVLLYETLVGNPFEVEIVTIASIVDKLRARARETPPGTWVEGYFFDDTKVKDRRELNVHDLDQVSNEHPVIVHHRGGHTSFYNSKALAMAAYEEHAQSARRHLRPRREWRAQWPSDRPGTQGRSTGSARAPHVHTAEHEQRDRDGLAYISKQFVRYGLTSVHHEGGDLWRCSRSARAAICSIA